MSARNKQLGDDGEAFVLRLLRERGYTATLLPVNSPTYDLRVEAGREFFISAKAARDKQHVRLGARRSVERLSEGNFVFAFLPPVGGSLAFTARGYRLLIIPAQAARDDALYVHDTYYAQRPEGKDYSVMVKGYSRRGPQVEVWERWRQFEDAWNLLPEPSLGLDR